MATVRYQSVSIRLRGSDIEDRNSAAKKSGNTPCTASPLPVRSATNAPMQPNASEIVSESRISDRHAAGPGGQPVAEHDADQQERGRLDQPERQDAGELAQHAARRAAAA